MEHLIGFGLILAHLVGDYLAQGDWQAKWKVAKSGTTTPEEDAWVLAANGDARMGRIGRMETIARWRPFFACTVHCFLYTTAVWLFSCWWMPWWGLVACFVAHWPVDRFRLAYWWMNHVSGQKFFASKEHPMFPWSIVIVDNTAHLIVLFAIGAVHFCR